MRSDQPPANATADAVTTKIVMKPTIASQNCFRSIRFRRIVIASAAPLKHQACRAEAPVSRRGRRVFQASQQGQSTSSED
jgi:hypothetical protein